MRNSSPGSFLGSMAGILFAVGLLCIGLPLAVCGGCVLIGIGTVPLDDLASQDSSISKNIEVKPEKGAGQKVRTYSIGDKVSLGNFTCCVDEFFWSKDLHPHPIANERADGRYLFIKLLVTNNGKVYSKMPRFRLVGDSGELYVENESLFSAPGALDRSEDLNPGVTRRGYIVFDVSQERVYRLELSDRSLNGKQLYVTIYDHKKEMKELAKDREKVLADIEAETQRRLEAEALERAKAEAVEQRKVRVWMSADGKFSVRARFVSMSAGKAKLVRTADNKEITVDVDILCDGDRNFIRNKGWLTE